MEIWKWDGELRGEIWDVENEEYHADRTADSSSTLKVARKSIELYEADYLNGEIAPFIASPEMNFGSAFHCALLEGGEFENRYAYEPDNIDGEPINKRLKAHREFLEEWRNSNRGKDSLARADGERIAGMLRSVRSHASASDLFSTGMPEVAVKFRMGQESISNYPLKAMFDWVCPERGIIADVKTTRHFGDMGVFRREIATREYHCQAALYCEAYRQTFGSESFPDFHWVFVHTTAPYETYVFKMGNVTRDIGLEVTVDTIEDLIAAKALNHFKPPSHGSATTIELPMWTLRKHNRGDDVSDVFVD